MPARQWQYQIKAQPVYVPAAAPPAVTWGWYEQCPDPVRAPARRLEGASVLVLGLAQWPVLLSSWYRPASEPVRLPLPRREGGEALVLGLAEWPVLVTTWQRPASEPVRLAPRRPEGGHFAVYAQPNWPVGMATWYRPASEPVRRPRRSPEGVSVLTVPIAAAPWTPPVPPPWKHALRQRGTITNSAGTIEGQVIP